MQRIAVKEGLRPKVGVHRHDARCPAILAIHKDAVLHDAIEAIKSGEGVDDRLDSLFAPLLQTNCADPLAL